MKGLHKPLGRARNSPSDHEIITRIFPLVIFLCFLSLPTTANGTTNPLVLAVEKAYRKAKSLQMEFVQSTYVPLLEKTVTRPGRIFYQKGGLLRIEYAGDRMTHYILNGQSLWVLDPQSGERQSYSLDDPSLPREALRFLTELGDLRRYFHVKVQGKDGMELKPKKRSTYKKLEAVFGEDCYLSRLVLHTSSGNQSAYRFFNLRINRPLSPKLFTP